MRVRDRSPTRPEGRQAMSVWQNRAQQGRTKQINKFQSVSLNDIFFPAAVWDNHSQTFIYGNRCLCFSPSSDHAFWVLLLHLIIQTGSAVT